MADETKHVSQLSESFPSIPDNAILYGYDPNDLKDKKISGELLKSIGGGTSSGSVDFVVFYNDTQHLAESGDSPFTYQAGNNITLQPIIATNKEIGQLRWRILRDGVIYKESNKFIPLFSSFPVGQYGITLEVLNNSGEVIHSKSNAYVFTSTAIPPIDTYTVTIQVKDDLNIHDIIQGVSVIIEDISNPSVTKTGTTNDQGEVTLLDVIPGEYRISATVQNFHPYNSQQTTPNTNIIVEDQDINATIYMDLNPFQSFTYLTYDEIENTLTAIYQFLPSKYEGNTEISYYLNDSPDPFDNQSIENPDVVIQQFVLNGIIGGEYSIVEGDTVTAEITFKDIDGVEYLTLSESELIGTPENSIIYFPIFALSQYQNIDGTPYSVDPLNSDFDSSKGFKNYDIDIDGSELVNPPWELEDLKNSILSWLDDNHSFKINAAEITNKNNLVFSIDNNRNLDARFKAIATDVYLQGQYYGTWPTTNCICVFMIPEGIGFPIYNYTKVNASGIYHTIGVNNPVAHIENVTYDGKLYTMWFVSTNTVDILVYDYNTYVGVMSNALTYFELRYSEI